MQPHPSAPAEVSLHGLLANLLNHLHDGPDRRLRLVKLDVVAALVGNHLVALGGQVEQVGLHPLPVLIRIVAARQHDQWDRAEACDGTRLRQAGPQPLAFVQLRLDEPWGH